MPALTKSPRVERLDDVRAERLALADLLDTLGIDDWRVDSLCAGWTVHDVLAHITLLPHQTLRETVGRVLRARGDFNLSEADWARERAAKFGPAELIGQLRETAGMDSRPAMSGRLDPLVDILVHTQDIARPLGRRHAMPAERVEPALNHVWRAGFYGKPAKRFGGLRFVATDAEWSAGEGPDVRGPIGELLMLATGRAAGLAGVTGTGVERVAAVLSAS